MDTNKITDLIISHYKEILSELDDQDKVKSDEINTSTVLLGKESLLDSLTLVRLIINVEQNINEEYDVAITIADERAMSQKNSPFRTIGTLGQYIAGLIEEADEAL